MRAANNLIFSFLFLELLSRHMQWHIYSGIWLFMDISASFIVDVFGAPVLLGRREVVNDQNHMG